jgi:hypothetical protein
VLPPLQLVPQQVQLPVSAATAASAQSIQPQQSWLSTCSVEGGCSTQQANIYPDQAIQHYLAGSCIDSCASQHKQHELAPTSAGGAGGGALLPPSAAATFCWSSGFSSANPASCSVLPMPASNSGASDSLLAGTAVGGCSSDGTIPVCLHQAISSTSDWV